MGMRSCVVSSVVERLFRVSREKLMSIPAFAWTHGRYSQAKEWLESFEAWRTVRRWRRLVRHAVRRCVREVRASQRLQRVSFQPR